MNMPGFTAHASLYRTNNRYRLNALQSDPQRIEIVPQMGGEGFIGHPGCELDCREKHRSWSRERCRRSCNDYGIAGESSDSWFNDLLTDGGIDFWEIGCSALSNAYVCGKMAEVMRRQS